MRDPDLIIEYHSLHHTVAAVCARSVAGHSLLASNRIQSGVDMPRGRASDLALFAEGRGLKVDRVNEHQY